jgi:hypothetical protein
LALEDKSIAKNVAERKESRIRFLPLMRLRRLRQWHALNACVADAKATSRFVPSGSKYFPILPILILGWKTFRFAARTTPKKSSIGVATHHPAHLSFSDFSGID